MGQVMSALPLVGILKRNQNDHKTLLSLLAWQIIMPNNLLSCYFRS